MATPFAQAVEDGIRQHQAHLGANENPPRSNKTAYGEAYGMNGVPYCAIALYSTNSIWGSSSGGSVKSASSGAIRSYFQAVGRSVGKNSLQRGDYVHVYKNGTSVHIERVLSLKNGRLICIGSNTSNTGGGSTADGGGTYINDRTAWWNNWGSNKGWAIKGASRPFYGVTAEDVKLIQARAGLKQDGVIGTATLAAIKTQQAEVGVKVDGFPGPATMAALAPKVAGPAVGMSKPVPAKPAPKAPAFPLPKGYAYGPASGPKTSVSGQGRNDAVPKDVTKDANGRYRSIGLYAWQKRMKERGWKIGVDGRYGPETEKVVRQFQKNKRLAVDGRIGPATWNAAWAEPVT